MALKHNGRAVITALVICAACLAMASCGFEEYVYLYPPDAPIFTDSKTIQFSNNVDNAVIPAFRGFKILYKFYSSAENAARDRSSISGYLTKDASVTYEYMKSLKYNVIRFDQEDSLTIPGAGDRSEEFTLEISFANPDSGVAIYYSAGSPSKTVGFNVGITDNPLTSAELSRVGGTSLGFSSANLIVNTTDLLASQINGDTKKTYLQCYVLSYGLSVDFSYTGEVYSQPQPFIGGVDNVVELAVN